MSSFPVLAFSVSYELEITGLFEVLDLAGIPVLAEERRGRGFPLIVAGGPLTYSNPDPLEPFVDVARAAAALGKKLYLYTNNHFAGNAVANAAQVRAKIGAPVKAPFPRTFLERFPQLEGVVRADGLF